MKKLIKKIFFAVVILALVIIIGIAFKNGKFAKLEGYMYSFAAEVTGTATDCNATSCDATSSNATSSNATSSNATSCNATSSNATSSNATSCNATSSNATSSNANNSGIKVNNNPETKSSTTTQKITKVEATPVVEETEGDFEYNNSEITSEVIEKIVSSDKTKNVIITIDSNAKVSKEIFNAIKGNDRQLTIKAGDNYIIFNGKDIVEPKDIDTTITSNIIKNDNDLKEIVQNGVVINFANNGDLPGTATIRIKATDEIKSEISLNSIYVYYYDETNKELVKLSNKATYKNGYIEFAINHNSKYVFVNEEIVENTPTLEETDNEVTFLESHKMYVIIITLSILAILFIVVILILDKKTKGKAYKQQ